VPDRILLVEDRDSLREMLARALAQEFEVEEAADVPSALTALLAERFAVVITDVRLPSGTGDVVLAEARRLDPAPEVVLMTAYAEVPAAVAALKAGAYDYLSKPFEPGDLVRVVRKAAERWRLVGRAARLETALLDGESGLVGNSSAMEAVRAKVDRLGPLPVSILVAGESGTGKEVVARELHRRSGRERFVGVNCGAIPEALLESELFGAARGAFTGATAERKGLFEEANRGTLLLDEVGDLPLAMQVKLNRVLEEGEVRRVGEGRTRPVDVRVVAATHRDLDAMVADGSFRLDLLYRLRAFEIRLPPLRDRPDDLPALCARFLHTAAARFGTPARSLAPDALGALERASWPGNVRELKHAMEHAAVMSGTGTIEVADLPEALRELAAPAAPGSYRDVVDQARDRAGRKYLSALLDRHDGNVTHAAAEAGVERESLHRLLRRHGIAARRYRDG
jgi:two-component system, NtrC family, response regulator AtoC